MTTLTSKVRSFPEETRGNSIPQALREVESAGHRALYGPEFGQARAEEPKNSKLQKWHEVLTGIYTGSTARGARFVAIAHIPHRLTNPDNIEAAINYGLVNGAAATPEIAPEATRLLELEGHGVFIVPYEHWTQIESGVYTLDQALEHPVQEFTKAFLGGLKKAENYLQNYHLKVVGDKIRIWKTNDPDGTARLGLFGNYFVNYELYAYDDLDGVGRFAGVQRAEGAAPQVKALEDLAGRGTDVGNGLVVIRREQISQEAYDLLLPETISLSGS